jgi:UDP-N-acetylglucosamine 4,6-dehydratase/5-epimerase
VNDDFKDKKIVITGGTGSFGSTVVSRLLSEGADNITIFSRDEKKQDDLRNKLQSTNVNFVIGDTRDSAACMKVMRGADLVFHAAALKQVPSCEFFPDEAVKTNVLGSNNVIESCISQRVKKLVVLSTDKAVMPINAMGISKAMMEKLAIAKGIQERRVNSGLAICVTRYGNVMSSRGSVIPRFLELAASGDALTITAMEMTRFMMTLEESVDLVFHAFRSSKGGELYIRKAPAASIETLIAALSQLLNRELETRIIGVRHGEKYHETLATALELSDSNEQPEYYQINPDMRDLNYSSSDIKTPALLSNDFSSDIAPQLSSEALAKKIVDAGIFAP